MRINFSRNQNLPISRNASSRIGFKSLTPDEQELKLAYESSKSLLEKACAKKPKFRHVKVDLKPNIIIQRLLGRDSAVKQLNSDIGLVYDGKNFSRISYKKALEFVSDLLCEKR